MNRLRYLFWIEMAALLKIAGPVPMDPVSERYRLYLECCDRAERVMFEVLRNG